MRRNQFRRYRLVWLSRHLWRRRLLFAAGGLAVGGSAVVLAKAADFVQAKFLGVVHQFPYAALLITPIGMAIAAYLTRQYFPGSQGSGIPQTIAARHMHDVSERNKLISLRLAIGKSFLTLFGLLIGASAGREGPTVQIGASLMHALGNLAGGRHKGLILAGGAAGVSAAFNTPLAGIVFAIEELSRSFEQRTSGLVIFAVIAAGVTSLMFLGDYTYFGHTAASLPKPEDWITILVCGIVGGAMGGIFSRILVLFGKGLPGRAGIFVSKYPVWFAAVCGLLLALFGLLSHTETYGTGYAQAEHLVQGTGTVGWAFGVLKLLATAITSVSGIPGGLFAPSLAAGAGFGANIAHFFPSVPAGAIILLAMVSYFSGVVQAPITAFVIVLEMTDGHALLVPLMSASLLAYGTSRLICPKPVYHALAEHFMPPHPHGAEAEKHPEAPPTPHPADAPIGPA